MQQKLHPGEIDHLRWREKRLIIKAMILRLKFKTNYAQQPCIRILSIQTYKFLANY